MQKDQILDKLYRSEKVAKLMDKVPEEFRADLLQEVFMLLLLKPEVEVIDLEHRGKLYSFFSKLVYNQMFWDRSQFHILYNTHQKVEQKGLPIDREEGEDKELPDIEPEYDPTEAIEDAMDKLSPYHEKLMRLYADLGTYRAVGDQTGIAWKSVYNAVTNARAEIKSIIKF